MTNINTYRNTIFIFIFFLFGNSASSVLLANTQTQKTIAKGTKETPLKLTQEIFDEIETAIIKQDLEKIESYLKKGIDIYNSKYSFVPLWEISISNEYRSAALLELFIKYGADVKSVEESGYNSLHKFVNIIGPNNPEEEDNIVKILVREGLDIEAAEKH